MASVECYKTCDESCQQKTQHSSFGRKVSDLFTGHHHQSSSNTQTQTQCCSQTKVHSQPGHATTKTQAQCALPEPKPGQATNGNATTKCHGRIRREHKKNLIHKIKDGLSGLSSDSGSSESDSYDEKCQKRKN